MNPEPLSAADGLVIAMLAVTLLSLGILCLLAACMRRNAARRDRQVDELLDELAEMETREKRAAAKNPDEPSPQPWEKHPDWWKH